MYNYNHNYIYSIAETRRVKLLYRTKVYVITNTVLN